MECRGGCDHKDMRRGRPLCGRHWSRAFPWGVVFPWMEQTHPVVGEWLQSVRGRVFLSLQGPGGLESQERMVLSQRAVEFGNAFRPRRARWAVGFGRTAESPRACFGDGGWWTASPGDTGTDPRGGSGRQGFPSSVPPGERDSSSQQAFLLHPCQRLLMVAAAPSWAPPWCE